MNDSNGDWTGRHWREIADVMTRENDPSKLLDLAEQLKRAFDGRKRNGDEPPHAENGHFQNKNDSDEGAENLF
jgi:hypothetical protein